MIGKTVRFARDERHGLPVGAKSFTVSSFSRQSKPERSAHEIGMF
jgi:hypothetical protein